MRVLITNTLFVRQSGSELYVRDVALELQRRGYEPVIYSPQLGPLAETLRLAGIDVVSDLNLVGQAPDLIHGQHHMETMAALARFPGVPAVYFCHGWMPWEELPPQHPRILRYVCVSAKLRDLLIRVHEVPESRVHMILNFVDFHRFRPRPPLPDAPRKALALSNQVSDNNVGWILRTACAYHGIRLDVVGLAQGASSAQPELLLPRYDLVLARGRAALEGLATGAAVICCDVEGLGPMVTSANYPALREANFGIQILYQPLNKDRLRCEIAKYNPADAARVSRIVRRTASLETAVDRILEVYRLVIDEWHTLPSVELSAENRASATYLKLLSETYRNHDPRVNPGKTGPILQRQPQIDVRLRLIKARVRGLLVFHDLKRCFERRPCGVNASVTPERWTPPPSETPFMACVVMSVGDQPTLVLAVQSLLAQKTATEIIVVNSGGGDPARTLDAAGIRVKVINRPRLLFPGAARNEGLLATRAPFVAFLAADCLAEAGWVEERLNRHLGYGAVAVSSAVVSAAPDNLWSRVSQVLLFARRMPGTPFDRVLNFGVSYDRRLFDRFGLFREDLRTGEDSEFIDRFTDVLSIVWAPEVRSAHFHPVTFAGLLKDQFMRGGRMAGILTQLTSRKHRVAVAFNALSRTFSSLQTAWIACRGKERLQLLGAAAFLPPATAAYALGALASRKTANLRRRTDQPPRVLALLNFYNEMRYLPDYFRNVAPQVDGIIALDDGSTDGSGEFAAGQPSVLELITVPPGDPHRWDEPRNRRLLVQAAWRHRADWVMVVDADERLERNFRQRALAEIERGEQEGLWAFRVKCRELWDRPDAYRSDGIWGGKTPVRLFKVRRDHVFDDRPLHGYWAPLNSQIAGDYPCADLIFYHLPMLRPEDRQARQAKYLRLDPEGQHQAIGYDYMTDVTGLQLTGLPAGREFYPPVTASATAVPVRIYALLVFHNEMACLPDYFRNVPAQVDGIIAVDDGSTDGSGDFVARQPSVIELVRRPPQSPHVWDEPANHRLAIDTALKHNADWLIAVDADERLERRFRRRAVDAIARGDLAGIRAFGVKFRELWNSPLHYRSDGLWGEKSQARFFKARADHEVDTRPMHGHWAPLNSKTDGGFPPADLIIYHLRMIRREDREKRRDRYMAIDPEQRWQPIGYEYLADETGLRLTSLPEGRDFEPLPTTTDET